MDLKKSIDIKAYIEKGELNIFRALVLVISIGYIVDLWNFNQTSKTILYNNITSFMFVLITIILFYLKKANIRICLGIIIYSAIANVAIDTFIDIANPNRIYFFLRDSVFIILGLTLAALIIKKINALIISILYLLMIIVLTFLTKNYFLETSLFLIIFLVFGYSLVVYYFVNLVERAIIDQETNTVVINEQAKQLLTKNEELFQLNATKDKFLSILAHDLRNPFSIIMGFADVLEKNFDKLDDSKKLHYISRLSSVSKKTNELLEDLLQWVRSQSKNIAYVPVCIDIVSLIIKNIRLFEENCKSKNITIIQETKELCLVFADEKMLDAVIRNLLSNAIKFTPTGGTVTIVSKKSENNIIVSIADTGIGIDNESLLNLFKIDKQHSNVGTAGEQGTGMGLLLCHDFIKKNNGDIHVSSEKGKGTVFLFSIPCYFSSNINCIEVK